jgi:hypothetical protein
MNTTTDAAPGVVRSLIPARIDRLPWSPFHTRPVMALGVAWVLDGLEITVASSVAGALAQPDTLNMSSTAGSDGNLTYLRDHRTRRVRTPDDARGRGCLRR